MLYSESWITGGEGFSKNLLRIVNFLVGYQVMSLNMIFPYMFSYEFITLPVLMAA